MGYFLNRDELIQKLYEVLEKAKSELFIVSPYFHLSDNIKLHLNKLMSKKNLKVRILFGKNEDDKSASLWRRDFDFLCEFNNVEIRYNESLHAKYFANEKVGVVTSLNMLESSLKNNLEVGAAYDYSWREDLLVQIFGNTMFLSDSSFDNTKAKRYFNDEFKISQPVFIKENGKIIEDFSKKIFQVSSNVRNDLYSKSQSSSAEFSKDHYSIKRAVENMGFERDLLTEFLVKNDFIMLEGKAQFATVKGKKKGLIDKKYMGNDYVDIPINYLKEVAPTLIKSN